MTVQFGILATLFFGSVACNVVLVALLDRVNKDLLRALFRLQKMERKI